MQQNITRKYAVKMFKTENKPVLGCFSKCTVCNNLKNLNNTGEKLGRR